MEEQHIVVLVREMSLLVQHGDVVLDTEKAAQ